MKNFIFKKVLAFLLFALPSVLLAQGEFKTRWDLAGTTTLSFGTATSGTVAYSWQEELPGTASGSGTFSGTSLTITGLPSTTIILSISPSNFQRIISSNSNPDKSRLLDVKQWGTTAWTSMQDAFVGCNNLNITATDIPDLALVKRADQMFQGCAKLTGPANINSWNTSSVLYMTSMFNGCKLFNQNIGNWNTANVFGMRNMFAKAESFNQNIGGWNTSKVGDMRGTFELATSFNQNIGNWNTAAVTMMDGMFKNASTFNQNIGNWSLNANVNLSNMLNSSGMDCSSYAATLIGWNANPTTPNTRTLGAIGRNYPNLAARTNLTTVKGWTITGDVLNNNSCGAFITRWDLAGTTTLSFGTATSGTVSYSWQEELPGTASGSGTFSGTSLTITGLPSTTIILSIYPSNFQRIISSNSNPDKSRLLDVKQWGTTAWTSMQDAFVGCNNLNITATDIPDLALVKRADQMFQGCAKLTGPANINSWNVSTIETTTSMFNGCKLFNQNIGSWNTANVVGMRNMFSKAESFNQNIGGWNTSKVGDMRGTFELATSFNQNIGNWNTAAVTMMDGMFKNASTFNQNIGNWSLNANVNLSNMLNSSGMDCSNYAATLVGWNANPSCPTGRTLGAIGINYGSAASAARTNLTTVKGWTITGDVQGFICDAFITRWNLATPNTNTLSFGTATSGIVNYIWKEVSPGTATGSGTFSGTTLTITGLPSGKNIRLFIDATNFQRIKIGNNQPLSHRLLDVEQWGTTVWTSMQDAFFGCSNLNITATDIPNLALVKKADQMFQLCAKLTGPANINSWNVSTIETTTSMFNGCKLFNQNIGSWNTANVVGMRNMFAGAGSFNQNIGGWNTSKVGDMRGTFRIATSFNQNIGNWNTAKVTMMDGMFEFATAFNQNIGNWNLNASVNLSNMLNSCGMDCSSYSATLVGWTANPGCPTGRTLGATGRTYGPSATPFRNNLLLAIGSGGKGWTITGDTTCAPAARMNGNTVTELFNVKAFPNPFASHFSLDIESSSDAQVQVKVYDMIGRQLEANQANVSELSTREIGRNYPIGVYNVVVSQGEKVKSLRMVKK